MNLKKLYIILILFIGLLNINSIFYASETSSETDTRFVPESTLAASVAKAVEDTNFNGSIMISQNTTDGYNVLYQGAAGADGGYSIDTIYDVGSVSKLYTTTAIMILEEQGKLSYSDTLPMFFDNVPADKQGITIKMLLTHTSGIYAEENDNHNVTKEAEVTRILSQKLSFEPGTDYKYSNAGFTLLAAIIEEVSGEYYEDFLESEIFDPLGFKSTGFPNSGYLKDKPAVSGTLNGVNYGNVTNFDFGWYSKGYADVLTTPRELTYFFNALINQKLIGPDNLKLMNLDEIDLGGDFYRGYGTDVKHYGTPQQIVGHTGIWYGGNTVVYYRPADKILFVLTCDQLNVSNDLPANYVFNTLNAMYPANTLSAEPVVESVVVEELINPESESVPTFEVDVDDPNNNQLIEPLTKQLTITSFKSELQQLINFAHANKDYLLIILCVLMIMVLSLMLRVRLKRKTLLASRTKLKMTKKKL